jgi:hypothetical protein
VVQRANGEPRPLREFTDTEAALGRRLAHGCQRTT